MTVRERSRELLRAELAEAAYDYFAARDFHAVTVDEVAHGIGISRATFFRYFGSKEEAVIAAVYSDTFDFPKILQDQAANRPDSNWLRLRRMFDLSISDAESRPETLRARIRLVESAPTLRSRLNERRTQQRTGVVEALAETEPDPRAARALVATAFALFDVAWGEWAATPGISFAATLDDLFDRFGPRERPTASA